MFGDSRIGWNRGGSIDDHCGVGLRVEVFWDGELIETYVVASMGDVPASTDRLDVRVSVADAPPTARSRLPVDRRLVGPLSMSALFHAALLSAAAMLPANVKPAPMDLFRASPDFLEARAGDRPSGENRQAERVTGGWGDDRAAARGDGLAGLPGLPIRDPQRRALDRVVSDGAGADALAGAFVTSFGIDGDAVAAYGEALERKTRGLRGRGVDRGFGGLAPRGGAPGGGSVPIDPIGGGTNATEAGSDETACCGAGLPEGRVSVGVLPLADSLTRSEIATVIDRHVSRVRYCYQRALGAAPELEARLVMRFVIGPDGSVTGVTAADGGLENVSLATCVGDVLWTMRFPAPRGGGQVVVHFPFKFELAGSP